MKNGGFYNAAVKRLSNPMARRYLAALILVLIVFSFHITWLAIGLFITCLVVIWQTVGVQATALQKSEESYRSILQNASDAIYLTDNTGQLLDMSNSMCIMLGYTKEELLQFKFSDMVDPETLKDLPIELPATPGQPIFKERTLSPRIAGKLPWKSTGKELMTTG